MSAQARATASAFQSQPLDAPAVRRLPDAKAMGLRLVRPVRSRARRAPFVVVVLTLLSIGLVGLVVMSTVLQAQSFKAASLHRTAAALQTQQQGLQREVEQLQSPSNVARRALVYGMVPNASPAFLRLSDGKVLGTPEAAVRGNNITRVVAVTARERHSRRRLRFCLAMVIGVFGIFGARLFQIQGLDASAYAAKAIQAGTAKNVVPAPRGEILDRNGVPLASSVDGLTLTANPTMTAANAPQIARLLVQKLGDRIDYFDTIDKLRTPKSQFVYVAHDVPAWTANKALAAVTKAGFTGVFDEKESLRTYPGGKLAANLIGYVNGVNEGVSGIEAQYNKALTGVDGSSTYEVSPTHQRIPMADSTVSKMVPGSDVTTTIDRDLQWYADQRLADAVKASSSDWGLAITMDVRTCQIVQMSQAPTFNADTGTGMTNYNTVSRAVQNVYEPGSVLKTVTMASLADQGKIAADSKIVVPSGVNVDGFHIGDYWQHGTIHLTAAGVIAKSSNLGTIVAASQMSSKTMYGYLRKFGFGQQTGVNLPGESQGILTNGAKWSKANHDTIAFGQGISVTAMQMMRADGAIANGGKICNPSVVSGITSPSGKKTPAEMTPAHRVISKQAAATVTRMMEAVTAPDGTAPAAAIKGYRVAGKTGTAWRVDPATGRYIHGQNTVSFMGFAPADKPRFLTYIVLDKPYSNAGGGSTAGPVFHDIMSMALERFGVAPTGSKSPKVPQVW